MKKKSVGETVGRAVIGIVLADVISGIIYLFLNFNHPSILIAAAFVCAVGVAFGICMKAMAGFFDKAADIQEENDLTI